MTTPKEKPHDPVFTTIDLGAEVKKMWGNKWGQAEISYEFGNGDYGRTFKLRTGDAAIYASSPDF